MLTPRIEVRHLDLVLAALLVQRPAGACPLGAYAKPLPVGGTVFVAANGVDSTDPSAGSEGAPVATLAKAWTLVGNGGTIAFRGGTYSQNALTKTGKQVHIAPYPGEPVSFDGQDTLPRLITFGDGTEGSSVRGVEVRRYAGTYAGGNGNERAPVTLNRGGTVEHCSFVDNAFSGLVARHTLPTHQTALRHVTVSGSGREGVAVGGQGNVYGYLLAEFCDFHDNGRTPTLTFFDLTSAGMKTAGLARADIRHNHVWGNTGKGLWVDVQSVDHAVYGNWCHHNVGHQGNNGDGIFWEISGDGHLVSNFCHDNTRSGIRISSGHRVYAGHNLLLRNRAGVWLLDANRPLADHVMPGETFQHPQDVLVAGNVIGDFVAGATPPGNAFIRYEHSDPTVGLDLADYGIALAANHYWRPGAGPALVSRIALEGGGDQSNATWAAHQGVGHDLAGSYSSSVTQPTSFGLGAPLPAATAARLGIEPGPYPAGLLNPLAITG